MHNFRELRVWKEAMSLAKSIYVASADFPNEERYGLTSQIRRSAVSVAPNIAEGAGRGTNKEFKQFLTIAIGSSYELETQILPAESFGFITKERTSELVEKMIMLQKMLSSFKNKLN